MGILRVSPTTPFPGSMSQKSTGATEVEKNLFLRHKTFLTSLLNYGNIINEVSYMLEEMKNNT